MLRLIHGRFPQKRDPQRGEHPDWGPLTTVNDANNSSATNEIPEQLRIRREKRARLQEKGEAYPVSVPRTHSLKQLRQLYVATPEEGGVEKRDGVTYLGVGAETQDVVSIAGRVIFVRNTGKLCFATLQDGDGTKVQAMLSLAEIGAERLADWKADVDLGDFVSVTGRVISSRRGELSVMASQWVMAAKSLRPLPVAHKEMSEDTRVRERYTSTCAR